MMTANIYIYISIIVRRYLVSINCSGRPGSLGRVERQVLLHLNYLLEMIHGDSSLGLAEGS